MLFGQFNKLLLILLVLLLSFVIAACSSNPISPAPVSKIKLLDLPPAKPETTYDGRTAIVKHGDNIYSIAFLAGFNPWDVARWNGLTVDSKLTIDQKIKLYEPAQVDKKLTPSTSSELGVVATPVTPVAVQATPEIEEIAPAVTVGTGGASGWSWPVPGKIISPYSAKNLRSGIQIAGELGTPVHASRNGQVVYAGDGLIGYGRIIIVKHDERFLSVYGHNSRLVVSEGDNVVKGQKIAEMGDTDADRVKLHFEIRKDGKAVDPMQFLPKS